MGGDELGFQMGQAQPGPDLGFSLFFCFFNAFTFATEISFHPPLKGRSVVVAVPVGYPRSGLGRRAK